MPETKGVPGGPLNEEEAAALHACFTAHVTEVRHFIDEHNLRMASPQGEHGPPSIRLSKASLVRSVCMSHIRQDVYVEE